MAREFARLLLSIRDDPGWQALTCLQQSAYCSIIASRDLSWAGVAPNLPSRFAGWSHELTVGRTRLAMDALAAARMIIVDDETDEVLVRTYIRYDGVLAKPNITRAMVKAFHAVHSGRLRSSIVTELAALHAQEPGLRGWSHVAQTDDELWEAIHGRGSLPPLPGLKAVS